MAAAQHVPAKMILYSGAGISGVGEQWKLTDISRMSSMSIQGAFGDSMRPSLQGLLEREKLPAVTSKSGYPAFTLEITVKSATVAWTVRNRYRTEDINIVNDCRS